ncbi:mechanosensitive ion channel family protein [Tenacibaculum jejuense]|uniref:Small-conductance mechanosensitive ion channel protein n=1 Tax=Tenacibaculum jejuense TaxID=584609 RepID=A0A238U4P3_9FLAO|nr:mechanosensitive ion channel family protein [Tenacibaculum jejuense]SNR14169.1 Small-conductance mechanosensitive ion channel protein [Tenacibaculum jejuense]
MEKQLDSAWSKLLNKLASWFDSLILNLPNMLIALLVFVLAYWFSRHLKSLANKYLKKLIKQPSIRDLVTTVLSVIIIILGTFLALSILNLDGTLKSLLAGAGVAGLAISLALQGTLSNTFSGIFIAIKDEMNIGDWVETNGFSGRVTEIGLRNTKIKEADNNIVVVPNKLILDQPFKNYGLTKRIRTTITCGVGYESDLKNVKKISVKAIKELFPPSTEESIEFYFTDFGDSSIDFLLRFWVDAQENLTALEVKSEAVMKIKEVFDNNNINIPFPIRTIINKN